MPTPSRSTLPAAFWPVDWALLDSPPASALDNMATDLALLRQTARTGAAVLRLYAWQRPTVSFGRHEPVRGVWDVNAMAAAGLEVVRRPTGGRALLHAHEVTYSVTMPIAAGAAWREVYDAVNARLITALQSLGAPVHLSPSSRALSPNGALCFSAPSEGEIMLGDEKIAGSAVWRANGGYLQHGSILLHNAQPWLERFRDADWPGGASGGLQPPPAAVDGAPRHVRTRDNLAASALPVAPHSSWSDAATVAEVIRNTWRAQARDICTFEPSAEHDAAHRVARRELASPDWLWRR